MSCNGIVDHIVKKASKSSCKYKVAAIAFDRNGNIIGIVSNSPRFSRFGGSDHAEMKLINRYGKNIKTIIVARLLKSGNIVRIDPCKTCSKHAKKLNIIIKTIGD